MKKVEYYRLQKGLSQREVGELLHVSSTIISQIERGFRKPWPKIRRQLSEMLGVPESDLFDEAGNCRETDEDFVVIPTGRR